MASPRPIIITGACGFVGANLCRYFSALGRSVIAVEGPSGAVWRLKNLASLKKINVDLTREGEVREFIRSTNPIAVFNLAAYGAYSSQKDAARIYRVNMEAVRYLLDAVRDLSGFEAFVQAGSSSEYGLNCKAPLESEATVPDSDYAVSKVGATSLVQYYGKKMGVPAWCLRLYSVYGPFEDPSRLILKLLLHAKVHSLPPLVNPNVARDFIYSEDVSRAFEAVLNKAAILPRGEVFNIGAGVCVTLEELVAEARRTFKVAKEPVWGSMANRHWDHADWFSNSSKASRELGWRATTSLATGLEKTMNWINENEELVRDASEASVVK